MGNSLLGMQFALLRHAARLQLILSPNTSKEDFIKAVGVEFDDVAKYRRENPANVRKKSPKIVWSSGREMKRLLGV